MSLHIIHRSTMYNLSAGPCPLFEDVKHKFSREVEGKTCFSLLETLHRGKNNNIIRYKESVESSLRFLLCVPNRFSFGVMNDGGSAHFSAFPLNYTACERRYYVNGYWSARAYKEGLQLAEPSTHHFDRDPPVEGLIHYCDNETIDGICFPRTPSFHRYGKLVSDMSSSILTKHVDFDAHACVYASASKNLGGGGGTSVFFCDELSEASHCPSVLSYTKHTGDFYNTPSASSLRLMDLTLGHIIDHGGIDAYSKSLLYHSTKIYETMFEYPQWFALPQTNPAMGEELSNTNIVFKLLDGVDLFEDIATGYGLTYFQNRFGGYRFTLSFPVLENQLAINVIDDVLTTYIDLMSASD